jgi:hypothetical protein
MANHSFGVQMSPEHIERNAKVNPKDAIKEAIWNSCDADATKIEVILEKNHEFDQTIETVIIKDNGHGLPYEDIIDLLGYYGRSNKTNKDKSPKGRAYHGKQGQGRYKSFAIGAFVKWESIYATSDGRKYKFTIDFNSTDKVKGTYSDKEVVADNTETGLTITIRGISEPLHMLSDNNKMREDLISTFAAYLLAYKDVEVFYDSLRINPEDFIQDSIQNKIAFEGNVDSNVEAEINLILWNSNFSKTNGNYRLYICGVSGIAFDSIALSAKGHPISVYLKSEVFDKMQQENTLDMGDANPYYESFVTQTKDYVRNFINSRFRYDAVDEVKQIKDSSIYPFSSEIHSPVEKVEQQYFDLLAVEINSIIPTFRNSSNETKKLTYRLIKEAVKTNPDSLSIILTEVFSLKPEEQESLAKLLEHTTLPAIINMVQTISNRLLFVHALEQMVYNNDVGKAIKERTQFHKILLKELWIFGEKYALGASDLSLKNVLLTYISYLERNELSPPIPDDAASDVNLIPDICLWQQYPVRGERIENLVIELKRPTHTLGKKELDQIKGYAFAVAEDKRFPKENTQWNFVLIGQDFNNYVKQELQDRKNGSGNFYNSSDGSIAISVLRWNSIIQENKLRLDFLRDKLSFSLEDSQPSIDYLHKTYADLFESTKKGITNDVTQ